MTKTYETKKTVGELIELLEHLDPKLPIYQYYDSTEKLGIDVKLTDDMDDLLLDTDILPLRVVIG